MATAGEVVTHFRTQKTAALFAFLAYNAGTPQPREELTERFWPEAGLDQGRMSLRTALASLRKSFSTALSTEGTHVMLTVDTDLKHFEHALRAARNPAYTEPERIAALREAVEQYAGPLLPGFYDDWVLRERERLAGVQLAALSALARWYAGLDELPQALDYARRAAALDPLSEEVRADLLRLLRKANRPNEALRQYQDLERLLQEQLGTAPQAATSALVAGLMVLPATRAEPESVVQLPTPSGRLRGQRELLAGLIQSIAGGKADTGVGRVFTLFGIGGIGKTRLAIEAGRRLAAHQLFTTIHFVPLAAAVTVDQAWDTLAATLGVPSREPAQQVQRHLGSAPSSLLILDNLEQLLPEGTALIETLLAMNPKLSLLATSRQRLALPGEVLFAVGALPEDDARALFLDRARSVTPEFTVSAPDEPALTRLLSLLEGAPLAIELAAAWIGVLTPAELAQQLAASRLSLSARLQKDPRHATLTAAIQWSTQLLDPELRMLFYTLSVFHGGWDTDAAQAICGASRHALASLRDRALVLSEPQENTLRFSLHESLRQFGWNALSPSQRQQRKERHAHYYSQWVRGATEALRGPDQHLWRMRLTREGENLRAGLAVLLASPASTSIAPALTYAYDLMRFWEQRGALDEGIRTMHAVLEKAATVTEPDLRRLRARTALAAAGLADLQGALDQSEHWLHQAESDYGDDREGQAGVAAQWATLALSRRDFAQALHRIDACLPHWRQQTQPDGLPLPKLPILLLNRGSALAQLGRIDEAELCFEEAAQCCEQRGDRHGLLVARTNLANVFLTRGALTEARQRFEANLVDARREGNERLVYSTLRYLSNVALAEGDCAVSLARTRESLPLLVRQNLVPNLVLAFARGAELAVRGGFSEESGALLGGFAEVLQQRNTTAVLPSTWPETRAALDPVAWERGRTLTLEEAIALIEGEAPAEPC